MFEHKLCVIIKKRNLKKIVLSISNKFVKFYFILYIPLLLCVIAVVVVLVIY